MSISSEKSDLEELSIPQEEGGPPFDIGLYVGQRNAQKERHGRGWAILPNGDQYDGQYRRGQRHGLGLYVFRGGARYYGKYRCGRRSGRGVFIYPDGSMYEGNWRKNLKHGKGRYCYANGDIYTGDWYHGERHGVGVYEMKSSDGCGLIRFKGTWMHGVRAGAYQVFFGHDDTSLTLNGAMWDVFYPQGPAIFTFNQQYMLMGYFRSPDKDDPYAMRQTKRYAEESQMLEDEGGEEQNPQTMERVNKSPTLFYAQEVACYDYSQLPQEPVPLPVSDSEMSVCSLSSAPSREPSKFSGAGMGEGEGEEGEGECEMECGPCECDCSDLLSESEPCSANKDPCSIEISTPKKCLNEA